MFWCHDLSFSKTIFMTMTKQYFFTVLFFCLLSNVSHFISEQESFFYEAWVTAKNKMLRESVKNGRNVFVLAPSSKYCDHCSSPEKKYLKCSRVVHAVHPHSFMEWGTPLWCCGLLKNTHGRDFIVLKFTLYIFREKNMHVDAPRVEMLSVLKLKRKQWSRVVK